MDTHCVCAGICSNTPLENLHYCVCARSQILLYRTWWCFVFTSFVCTILPCIKTGFSIIQAFQVCVFVVFRIRFYCIVEFFPIPFPIPYPSPDTEQQADTSTRTTCGNTAHLTRQHNPVPDIFVLITPSTISQDPDHDNFRFLCCKKG